MTEVEIVRLETELPPDEAAGEIAKAVSARHSIARRYVLRLRRRNPEATPAEVIAMLERHYRTSISAAGAMIAAGAIAADVGIALIPVAGAAAAGVKSAGQQAAKRAGKEAVKAAAKNMALGAAKSGAKQAAALLPAGDEQLQFEITAVFALALADIHGMTLDQDQSHALIYGLTNGRVNSNQIAQMASDVADSGSSGVVETSRRISAGKDDWSHWANTLADALPGGAAQNLVRTIQTGELQGVQEHLSGKQRAAVEYGVGALAGGVTRFVFGRDVIEESRRAFAEPPEEFPAHLALAAAKAVSDDDSEGNRAVAALEDAARATGTWFVDAAGTVRVGVSSGVAAAGAGMVVAAGTVSRPFRSVDLDGDGIPDEPQALSKLKSVAGLLKSRKRNLDEPSGETPSES